MFVVIACICLGFFGGQVSVDGAGTPYETIGCFRDYAIRAIPTLEGLDPILDGDYWTRQDPITKCYRASKKRGFPVFALQDGGWCAAGLFAVDTFDRYGKSSHCKPGGEGGPWANQVYVIKGYSTVGCYKDNGIRAIPSLEGADSILDGSYASRKNPVAKCAVAAMRAGYSMFAVQDGGWCASSEKAPQTYNKYGESGACLDGGEGGNMANQVYSVEVRTFPYETIGCFQDYENHTIPSLEGLAPVLDGPYWVRQDPIHKCYQAAISRGFQMFAVQHGGLCAASATAHGTFDKYGKSSSCESDGEGGPRSNQVYYIKKSGYKAVGCYKDTAATAIPTLEGQAAILDGSYWTRRNPVTKCAVAAMRRGYKMFAIQDGGACQASATAPQTYDKYGASDACLGSEGGPLANQVYSLEDYVAWQVL